jgi:hypothetical protein
MPSSGDRVPATRIGVWIAPLMVAFSVVSFALGITTPPRSGPYCRSDCIRYPYTDAAAFVPRDYLWMYPAVLLTLLLVVLAGCVHHWVPPQRRLYSLVAGWLIAIGAGALVVDYGVQLTVLQPALLAGETEGLSPLSQYNPHGVFIALENVGYASVNLGFLFLGTAIPSTVSRLARAARWAFIAGGSLTTAALIGYAAGYRAKLDYRFEVVSLGLTWLVLIIAGVMLSILFRRATAALPADHAG